MHLKCHQVILVFLFIAISPLWSDEFLFDPTPEL